VNQKQLELRVLSWSKYNQLREHRNGTRGPEANKPAGCLGDTSICGSKHIPLSQVKISSLIATKSTCQTHYDKRSRDEQETTGDIEAYLGRNIE